LSAKFAELLSQFKNVNQPNKITVGGVKQMVIGGEKIRIGVYGDDFENLKKALEKV
jgi:hypothetical protein